VVRGVGISIGLAISALAPGAAASDPPPCGGLLQPQCPPPPPPEEPPPPPPPEQSDPTPPPNAKLTLRTSASDINLVKPRRIVLSGQITGIPQGSRPRLVLRAESLEFGKAFDDVEGRSDPAGNFRFRVRPELNTVYRVATADGEQMAGQSRPVMVRVYPLVTLTFHSRTLRTFRARLLVAGPWVLNFADDKVKTTRGSARYAFYYRVPRRSKFAYRIGRARLGDGGCGEYCYREAWKLIRRTPRIQAARSILGCLRGTGFRGMGLPTPACGRRAVRLR
jgi:hypothetical protein